MEKTIQNQVICGKPLLNLTFFIDSKSKFKISVYTITKLIKDELGGNISFTLNSKVDYLITNNKNYLLNKSSSSSIYSTNNQDYSKIKLINDTYFIEQQQLSIKTNLNDSYLISSGGDDVNNASIITPLPSLCSMTINNDGNGDDDSLKITINARHIPSIVYGVNELKQPYFPEDYLILKSNILSNTMIGKHNVNKFYYLELQQAIDKNNNFKKYYRIFSQFGRTDEIHKSNSQHRYCGENNDGYCDLKEAMLLYSSIYSQKIEDQNGYIEVKMNNLSTKIGSPLKLKLAEIQRQKSNSISNSIIKIYDEQTGEEIKEDITTTNGGVKKYQSSYINSNVCNLIDMIYKESSKCLIKNYSIQVTENGIETQLGTLSISQIEKAQLILDEIERQLNQGASDREVFENLSSKFYQLVPSKLSTANKKIMLPSIVINSFEKLFEQSELLEMMKDLTNAFNFNLESNQTKNHLDMKYYALNIDIQHLHPDSLDYRIFIRNFLMNPIHQNAIDNKKIEILNCFKLEKQSEIQLNHCNGNNDYGNFKFLYHASKPSNLVGILSRGLLLPNVIQRMGGKRSDFGFLGPAIYFHDNIISSPYSSPIGEKGSRLVIMSTVSLGNVKEYSTIQPHLNGPPSNYNSCKGLKSNDFKNDEYAIYNPLQTKLSFLIEYIERK